MDWALVGVLERLGKQQTPGADGTFRVTLGDVLMAAPPGSGSPDLLRDGLLAVLRASRGAYALSDAGEVVFCFPSALRAAVLKHSASERLAAWRRKAARFAMVCARVLFAFMLVFSLLLALLAIIAIFIISVTQGGRDSRDGPMLPLTGGGGGDGFDGGGGGGPGYRHDGFGDLYLYLMLRDINMAIWMTEADRRHAEMQRVLAADVGAASPSKPGGRPAPGGGGAPPPGGEGDGGGEPPPPPPPPTRWFDLASEEEDAAARHPSNSSLSFVESVFAFVFGRPSPNEDLEPRRMRAIGMLLRACGGCVLAEQVAPFCDDFLLRNDAGAPGGPQHWLSRLLRPRRRKGKEEASRADARRLCGGHMLPVLAHFGGHVDASDDGQQLVYVFPLLRFTAAASPPDGGGASSASAAPRPVHAQPPLPPPLYEKPLPLFDGGDKQPLVILLGVCNIFLLLAFRAVGGMSFAPGLAADGSAAARALGRRGGGGFAASAHHGPREVSPATMAVLVALPSLCARLWPLLAAYAAFFFACPLARAALAARENVAIKARNAVRKRVAGETLADALAALQDGRDAAASRRRAPTILVAG